MSSHNDPGHSHPSMFDDLIRAKARDRTRRRQLAIALVPIVLVALVAVFIATIKSVSTDEASTKIADNNKQVAERAASRHASQTPRQFSQRGSGELRRNDLLEPQEREPPEPTTITESKRLPEEAADRSASEGVFRPAINRDKSDDALNTPDAPPESRKAEPSAPEAEKQNPPVVYQGKPAAYWVQLLRDSIYDEKNKKADVVASKLNTEAAGKALVALGPAVQPYIPDLIALLKRTEPPKPGKENQNFRNSLLATRKVTLRVLEAVGPSAAPAIPELLKLLKSQKAETLAETCSALGAICARSRTRVAGHAAHDVIVEDVVPALRVALRETEPIAREEVAKALGEIGPEAEDAIPDLIATFPTCGMEPPTALAKIGKAAIPALVQTLRDKDERVCMSAALALGQMGRDAAEALPVLKVLLAERQFKNLGDYENARKAVEQAIRKIEGWK